MRILMLGNSFTFYNDMPSTLADLIGAEVIAHTRGGARLSEHLNPDTQMGAKTLAALENEAWDYVVLQEMSNGPVTSKNAFRKSVALLCEKIRAAGAMPVLYATWAYARDCERLAELGLSYEVMAAELSAAYRDAAEQNDALLANVGQRFYQMTEEKDLYAEDRLHPNEEGSRLAAETIAEVIREDQEKRRAAESRKEKVEKSGDSESRLRLLYLYHLFLKHTDKKHPLTTNQIRSLMELEHGITMHRTTLSSDVDLLIAAGFPIHVERSRANKYFLEEAQFSLPELKILIDAVESSKFITKKQSDVLVRKLMALTSEMGAEDLKRNLFPSGRVRSGNEKGYFIVDRINRAINKGKRISFLYTDYDVRKQLVVRHGGEPYTVSPYALIWSGDFYYMVGYYHEKERMNTFRVDRILAEPTILNKDAMPRPEDFNIDRYTKEVFRMYDTEEPRAVTLRCENSVMKGVIDKFGLDTRVKVMDEDHFSAEVKVCTSPTFYSWVFQWGGRIQITAPEETRNEYREMARAAAE